jgi:hypothetical protein
MNLFSFENVDKSKLLLIVKFVQMFEKFFEMSQRPLIRYFSSSYQELSTILDFVFAYSQTSRLTRLTPDHIGVFLSRRRMSAIPHLSFCNSYRVCVARKALCCSGVSASITDTVHGMYYVKLSSGWGPKTERRLSTGVLFL